MNLYERTIQICFEAKNSHLASAISALPIIEKCYRHMNLEKDTFILSKGHGCPSLYAVLESYGYKPNITKSHPDIDVDNGISCTTGSLGHGLPIACGIAYATKLRKEDGNVYVLMGDGECAEGTTWESANFAIKHSLKNLFIIIDHNQYQALEKTIYSDSIHRFKKAFPELNIEIITSIKGEPLSIFKHHPDWHVHTLTAEEYQNAIKEVL
jgi:transketolase